MFHIPVSIFLKTPREILIVFTELGKMVGDVVYCGLEIHMDDPELGSDDAAEVGVWKKRERGERVQAEDEGSDRSSNTADG